MISDFFNGEVTLSYLTRALEDLYGNEEALRKALLQHKRWEPRSEGVPAMLILEDFCAEEQVQRQAAPGDEGMGILYSLLLSALTAQVVHQGAEDRYPPHCAAMSVLADTFMRLANYGEARDNNNE